MANRHLSRSIAMQSLFEWDFREGKEDSEAITDRVIAEFGPGIRDKSFIEHLVQGVIERKDTLDAIIEKAAKDWPIDKTPLVDRNILRMGLFELLYSSKDEVPARVALNEAIELGKTFGGERSGKFVNGVLGTIYKEMGEPGKFDEPKKKKRLEGLSAKEKADLPLERLGGALVYSEDTAGKLYLAFVHDIFGYWTLSKGRIEGKESDEAGAAREIKEEINLDVIVEDKLGENEYVATSPEKGRIRKRVSYFLAKAQNPEALQLAEKGGLNDAKWFSLPEIKSLKTYEDIRSIIEAGVKKIQSRK